MLTDELIKHDKFAIFGALVIAYGAYVAIKALIGRTPGCFAVGKLGGEIRDGLYGNPTEIEGIEVKLIDDVSRDAFIVVGVTELVQKEVVPMLKEKGFSKLFVLTQHEEHLLMSEYFDSIGKFPLLSSIQGYVDVCKSDDIKINNSNDCNSNNNGNHRGESLNIDLAIYEVGSHIDKPLSKRRERL